jgi:hypothetical protein
MFDGDLVSVTPPTSVAARMFAMNFASWRARPAVGELASARELDAIETGLTEVSSGGAGSAPISWRLRQLTIANA